MSDELRVVGIAGSLRRESYNRRLLAAAVELAPEGLRIEPVEVLRLPLFDQDLEADGDPDEVLAMRSALDGAGGVLLATPEYNFGVPGPVKNLVDWASRPPGRGPLVGKPVMLMGASTGRLGGTVQAQSSLRISLAVCGAAVLPSPPVLVAEAAQRFDGDELTDEATRKVLGVALARFAEWIRSVRPH